MASPTHSDDDGIIDLANPDSDCEQSRTNSVKKVKNVNQKIRRSNSSKDESNKSVELRHGLKQQIDFVKEFVIDGCKAGSQKLPVYAYQDDLLKAVDKHQVLVVIGEAGSGKTTQVPQYLHKGGFTKRGTIACTLPRCGAAISAAISGASKVSHQLGVSLGEEVGYSTRFKDCLSEKTTLKYMADEVLLRELIVDDRLASYGVIMIDNAHERSVSSDILIPLIKDILSERPDLKLLISSDTLDVMNFVDYFNCSVFRIDGRKYPVEVHSVKAPESDYLVAAIVTILQIHVSEPPGDILVFLPDQNDIRRCVGRLNEQCKDTKIASLLICPEPSRKIERTPKGVRKVVFATDIAETSVSNDIKYVIDPGFCRQKVYIPETETESFVMCRITQVLALQRAERVGRDCPGKCFRLYTPHSRLTELSDVTVPEIQRTNLAYIILLLKCIGVHDIDPSNSSMAAIVTMSSEQWYFSEATTILDIIGSNGNSTMILPTLVTSPRLFTALKANKSSNAFNTASAEVHSVKAPKSDYLVAAIVAILQIHVSEPPRDILVFLPDQNDIRRCVGRLNEQYKDTKIASLLICPEPSRKIKRTPKGVRKVVFATDIAETSVSNDIKYVIDPGFCRQKVYIPETETESFVMCRITQVLALQRAERVGRDCPGKCFRLYTPHSRLTELSDVTVPEIQRTNLAYTILLLKCIGVHDIVKFDFIDSPPTEAVLKALELLFALSAVNKRGEVTKMGRIMAEFPLDPMMSKMVVASEKYHCSDDIVTIAAMLEFEGSISCPKDKEVHADKLNFGDHIGLLKIYNSWKKSNYSQKWCYRNHIRDKTMKEVKIIRDHLAHIIEKVGMELTTNNDIDSIKKSIASGYFPHLAKLQKFGSYQTCKHGQTVYIHPASGLAQDLPKLVVYHKVEISGTKDYINVVTEIQPKWLSYISPHYHDIEEGRKTSLEKEDAVGHK